MNQIIRKGGRTAAVIDIILLENDAGRWTRQIGAGADVLPLCNWMHITNQSDYKATKVLLRLMHDAVLPGST